jgi:hypothetical protein
VLTAETSVFAHVVVGEGLDVAFDIALPPRHIGGELATTLPLGDRLLEEIALVVSNLKTSDCRSTHVVVCHSFNVE